MPQNNLDALALQALYAKFLAHSNQSNMSSTSLAELMLNQNNASLSDILNMSQQQQSTNSNATNQLKNNSSLNSNLSNALKQRQDISLNNRLINSSNASNNNNINNNNNNNNSSSQLSNVAALTSATSNIASLLNQNQQRNMFNSSANIGNNQSDSSSVLKRRVNSIATTYNMAPSSSSGSNGSNNANGNNSPLFAGSSGLNQVGQNASYLLQNSSLASSARISSSTTCSAAASVLGNNSTLSHAISSLQHQSPSNNLSATSQSNNSLLNSSLNGMMMSNFNTLNNSPTPTSNHSLLSALSLSTSSASNMHLSSSILANSSKPLRSERLPQHIVEDIVKQAKIRRRNGGKKEVCVFCRNNGEKEQIYTSHTLKDASNNVACPILRLYQCPICHASGNQAHTIKYCPYAEKDSTCIKLFKENGRMSAAAAAFLMNSLAGNQTPPTSPPETPSPQSAQLNFLNHQTAIHSPTSISSPNNKFTLAHALSSFNNFTGGFNTSSVSLNESKQHHDLELSLNKSFGASLNANQHSSSMSTAASNNNGLLTSNFSNSSNLNSK